MTATKDKDNHYSYNTVTVVLLTEFVKLLVAVGLQMRTYVETLLRFPHYSLFYLCKHFAFIQMQSSFVHWEKQSSQFVCDKCAEVLPKV